MHEALKVAPKAAVLTQHLGEEKSTWPCFLLAHDSIFGISRWVLRPLEELSQPLHCLLLKIKKLLFYLYSLVLSKANYLRVFALEILTLPVLTRQQV